MSRQTHIFVGSEASLTAIMAILERALDRPFIYEAGSDPYIRVDPVAIYIGQHEFGDDDITWPHGAPIPLHSQYPHWIEVRDAEKDPQRQESTAARIVDALKAAGRWKLVYIDDMQQVVDWFEPGGAGSGARADGAKH